MKAAPVRTRTVLITGCSSGIGATTATHLRERGWRVAPTARKPEDLDRLRSEGFEPIALDVQSPAAVERAAAMATQMFPEGLGALVNNAGFGQPGAVEDVTRDELQRQFEVNVIGVHDLTRRLIPTMIEQGYGRIVNIGSILGLYSLPFMGAYAASKFALEALTDALRAEMSGTGIGVALIGPGPIRSSFRDNATHLTDASVCSRPSRFDRLYRRGTEKVKEGKAYSRGTLAPMAVAKKIEHALTSRRPRGRYSVTTQAMICEQALRVLPKSLIQSIMAHKARQEAR